MQLLIDNFCVNESLPVYELAEDVMLLSNLSLSCAFLGTDFSDLITLIALE